MGTITHSVTIWHTHRDWVALWVQIAAPVGSVMISAVALSLSWLQSREARKQTKLARRDTRRAQTLAERSIAASEAQANAAQAKLRLELFEERYKAWNIFDEIVGRYREAVETNAPRTLDGLTEARRRMYVLFDDDVNIPALRLVRALLQYDRDNRRMAEDQASGGAKMKEPMRVKVGERIDRNYDRIDELTEQVRSAAKGHSRLSEIR